jgi:hypothetical protein
LVFGCIDLHKECSENDKEQSTSAAATVRSERRETLPLKLQRLQICEGGAAVEEGAESPDKIPTREMFTSIYTTLATYFVAALRGPATAAT